MAHRAATYQPAPTGYSNPSYNSGYYSPACSTVWLCAACAVLQLRQSAGEPRPVQPADGRRYTTVTVTNRGQNGNRDDVVQQQVVCGSQYYDGYRTRTAPRC